LISSKENSEENTRDRDAVIELHPEEPNPQHQGSHQVLEEDSQEESGEETDVEIPKIVQTTKARRKTNKAKRESDHPGKRPRNSTYSGRNPHKRREKWKIPTIKGAVSPHERRGQTQ
jgi:hypothetical protein